MPLARVLYRCRTLGSADAYSRSAGAILLAGSSSACLGRTLRKYDAASSGCPCPHPRRYPCHDPCRSPVRQRTRIGIRIGTRIGTAHWRRCRPFLPSSSCRGQRLRFAACVLARRQQRPRSPLCAWFVSDGRPHRPARTRTYGADWACAGNVPRFADTGSQGDAIALPWAGMCCPFRASPWSPRGGPDSAGFAGAGLLGERSDLARRTRRREHWFVLRSY